MNYHDKKFVSITNSENGELEANTVFHYKQEGNILTCEYSSGDVIRGHLIGVVDAKGNIDMRYHQINAKGEIMTGTCHTVPERMPNGKLRLHENWQWTSGDLSTGNSILEEV